jgi:VCBS repeat protein
VKRVLTSIGFAAAIAAIGCSSATSPGTAAPPAPTPTPPATAVSRVNPYVVEETETYTIQRYPKEEYIRVDDRHIRHPILGVTIEFFREDENYFYVSVPKHLAEEQELRRRAGLEPTKRPDDVRRPEEAPRPGPPLSDFQTLQPPRVPSRMRLEKVDSGLPDQGLWRSSFVVADVNEDGQLDIVAPPSRIGGQPVLHIWVGDGKGKFTRWPLTFTEAGKEKADPGVDYGAVAVGDLDRDGHPDVAVASHGGGIAVFMGNGKGGFRVVRTGLPGREFSAQAVILLDANRDGKLDIVASRDVIETESGSVDKQQVRLYVNLGDRGWQFHDGIVGGFYSNSLHAWDYDGDGRKDVLSGSHYNGALSLIWRNEGTGEFTPVSFPDIEIYAYHFATAPGTFGKDRVPAFADAFYMTTMEPEVARAGGITLYALRNGSWTRHRVWRKKESKTLQYALAMGDLDGDGLDDIVFPDSDDRRLKLFFQQADGSFVEAAEKDEPALDSPGQCARLVDLDKDGRLDIVLSKTVSSTRPDDHGGWDVYLNRR